MAIDNFYLEKVFPEPDKLFEFEFKSFNQINEDSLFVFDTNVLFVPFLVSTKSFKDYKKICKKLREEDRLFLPARVAREFAKNRGDNIKHIYRKLRESRERLSKGGFDLDSMPILEDDDNYKEIKKIEKKVTELRETYRKKIDALSEDIKNWNWDDPVSKFYMELWSSESIVEVKKSHEDLLKDLKFRQEHQLAPGYKDKSKIDEGIGDVIIWQTLMELSKEKENNLVFVTNESKNDWFYNEKNTSLYPKFELFDEFRRFTNGKSLAIISFKQFLISQQATEDTIKEVQGLRAESGFLKIENDVLLEELKKALKIASSKNGFVSSKFFVETILANQFYDIASSWALVYQMHETGIIDIYTHIDESGQFPPISALRLGSSI